ncbi:MAG: tetratricopeptide repeat protein [Candidatus Tectomicrobia bacterium]|uniref:Tetratricopeptide repeat protein n=1 Tax=Tectimicrobiota bacterium TaxID=2528274 RepID=A0A937W2Z4_UNCTE|nr:tetratricopeptide repeat protein [Candidatus Tectomicrobia bacterium]
MRHTRQLLRWLGVLLLAGHLHTTLAAAATAGHPASWRAIVFPEFLPRTPGGDTDEVSKALQGFEKIDELQKGLESFQRRDYEQTLSLFKTAGQKAPHLPPANLMLARLLFATNQQPQGRVALEQAAVEQAGYPGVYLSFASLALTTGRLTDAFLHLEKAASLLQGTTWTAEQRSAFQEQMHLGFTTVAEGRRDWEGAKKALTAWLELNPKNGQARQRLARTLLELDNPAAAQEQLQQAVKDDANLDPAPVALAWLYTQKGNLPKATELMQNAVKQAPKDARVHRGMASWLLQQGKLAEAKAAAEVAARLEPDAKELRLLRALIARGLKDYGQAETYFQALHQETPGDVQVANQLALTLVEQTDKLKQGRAVQLAEVNARANANVPEVLATLG